MEAYLTLVGATTLMLYVKAKIKVASQVIFTYLFLFFAALLLKFRTHSFPKKIFFAKGEKE